MAVTRYAGDRFSWLEADPKPTNVLDGARGIELDTGQRWYYYDGEWREVLCSEEAPSIGSGVFTGATIPLTYKDNTTDYENEYVYESFTHDITIDGLAGRATITGNGTKSVTVAFDVTSAISSLKNFTITCEKGAESLVYNGMHAHYGTAVTGILTFAYTHITKDGSEGDIGTEYIFIETNDETLPLFATETTRWEGIYSYQVLNVLIANYSLVSVGDNFLGRCLSFNQPLTLPSGVTSIGNSFLSSCFAFNQPLTIPSGVTSIGSTFLLNCYAFNQPITLPSGVTSIGNFFLSSCYAFNQTLTIPSGVTSIGTSFLGDCTSFNQPLTIPSGVTSIGNGFLSSCFAFNQPLTIPSGVTSVGTGLLYNCRALSVLNYESSTYPTDNNSLSQTINSKTDETNGEGIKIYGTNRAGLISALPDRTISPFRKLIDGGS